MNERIDVPASQRRSAYWKASRSVDCAFASASCRANSLRYQNLLFPIYRARTGLRAVWANNPLHFRVLAAFAIGYDLLPHTPEPSITHGRPLIDYLYYEIITFTSVGYGDLALRV